MGSHMQGTSDFGEGMPPKTHWWGSFKA